MLKLSEYVRSTHNHDGALLLDVRHGKVFSLNPIGSRIFDLLQRDYVEPRIATEISLEFGVDREIVVADVREFLEMLEKHRLLERQPS